ncbi:zinc finger 438 [Pelobates cultripes]|uniref:Zinc finger 438 n=1 Tax=Pelobates cultripes TaxID=61616 RepID=A0AAD1RV37_PELCU|nr:zinc finger 438 [Pelobates cultripes]
MQCRKIAANAGHFRTIAPKIVPKVASSTASCSTSQTDIAVSSVGTKPLVMPAQNYTLMKVPGQNGTFSFVAVPQVNSMGAPVIQTTNTPLQENLKLPIPRCQSARNKRLCDKVKNISGLKKTKSEKLAAHVIHDNHPEAIPELDASDLELANPTTISPAMDVILESNVNTLGVLSVNASDTLKANTSALSLKNDIPKVFCTSSPMKMSADLEKVASTVENGPMIRCESTKVVDSANAVTVLSPVMFGGPPYLISSAPKGKLPIMPYSKIKKSIISKCKQSANTEKATAVNAKSEICKGQASVKTSNDISLQVTPVSTTNMSTLDSCQSSTKMDTGVLTKPSCVSVKKRAKKRKTPSEIMAFQTKMRLVGNKLVVCKDKVKDQVLASNAKIPVCTKKYRSIMPKPAVEVQCLASLGTCDMQSQPMDIFRNRFQQIRSNRWKQGDCLKQSLDCRILSTASKACFKCHVCDHNFQFKHHLQDHLNTHTNRRPYHCRLCRKSYVHSGSLSTHVKLHHSESRLKKLMCCEFCAKVFGHIRVYFGHLKEVHKVIISTETSTKQLEKKDITKVKDELTPEEIDKGKIKEDDTLYGSADEIKLQIKCGRCDVISPTFSDMKLHLFCEHGDQFQERLQEGILESRQGAPEEVVKHATHYWKLLNERRNVFKCSNCEQEIFGSSKLRKHVCLSYQENTEVESDPAPPKEKCDDEVKDDHHASSVSNMDVQFYCGNYMNCILCKQVFEVKDELLAHWQQNHNCENPSLLWTVFNPLSKEK